MGGLNSTSLKNRKLLDDLASKLPELLNKPVREANLSAGQPQRRLTAAEREQLLAEYQAGARVKELAFRWGIARSTVSEHLRLSGIRRASGLTPYQIGEARRLYLTEQWSLQRIGDRLGFSHSTVRNSLLKAGVQMRNSHGRAR